MKWDGMYPQHNCKTCNTPLNADGGHPAELYAGTYTGLCYKCQNAPAFVVKTYHDGAQLISYRPDCPSWRRDRPEYHAYSDCPTCKGTGRVYVSHANSKGGSYHRYCHDCFKRFYAEPQRVRFEERQAECVDRLLNVAEAMYHAELRRRRWLTRARKRQLSTEEHKAATGDLQTRYVAAAERYRERNKEEGNRLF